MRMRLFAVFMKAWRSWFVWFWYWRGRYRSWFTSISELLWMLFIFFSIILYPWSFWFRFGPWNRWFYDWGIADTDEAWIISMSFWFFTSFLVFLIILGFGLASTYRTGLRSFLLLLLVFVWLNDSWRNFRLSFNSGDITLLLLA